MNAKNKQKTMQGQISVEMLVIVGISMAIMVPLLLSVFSQLGDSQYSLILSQADAAAQRLASGADTAMRGGAGSKLVLSVQTPPGIKQVKLQGKEIILIVEYAGRTSEIVKNSQVALSSSDISALSQAGNYNVLAEAEEDGGVFLSIYSPIYGEEPPPALNPTSE